MDLSCVIPAEAGTHSFNLFNPMQAMPAPIRFLRTLSTGVISYGFTIILYNDGSTEEIHFVSRRMKSLKTAPLDLTKEERFKRAKLDNRSDPAKI